MVVSRHIETVFAPTGVRNWSKVVAVDIGVIVGVGGTRIVGCHRVRNLEVTRHVVLIRVLYNRSGSTGRFRSTRHPTWIRMVVGPIIGFRRNNSTPLLSLVVLTVLHHMSLSLLLLSLLTRLHLVLPFLILDLELFLPHGVFFFPVGKDGLVLVAVGEFTVDVGTAALIAGVTPESTKDGGYFSVAHGGVFFFEMSAAVLGEIEEGGHGPFGSGGVLLSPLPWNLPGTCVCSLLRHEPLLVLLSTGVPVRSFLR